MEAMHAPIFFERYDVHGDMKSVPSEVIESIHKNKICLKGGFKTPVGGGVSLLNVQLRKELDLYASLVNCFNLPGLPTCDEDVDIVVVRENTEGEYSGLKHEVVPGVVESLKVQHAFSDSERDRGYLVPDDVYEALVKIGFSLDSLAFYTVCESFDQKKNGRFRLDDFISLCIFVQSTRNMFNSFDTSKQDSVSLGLNQFIYCTANCRI
ncbi:isocitrate dehydrogenase [NAD] regulatory subunit 1, mitochondrial-like isoform X3 [Camellia sinensis]|uniref:isocitrate dehydrogenase [NAD] regulatory subunit 1, mitochondrial-like isoform X3 n=1 Tax=Camellia sinensis TaxID=4442 RepID=UPI0010360E9B|nr:isocitrate dehydrogenase [NAD] regulatory subunit 1, mitochondrial-like isoform X3 [Camellia sinensis]